jgi:hypothetical protein
MSGARLQSWLRTIVKHVTDALVWSLAVTVLASGCCLDVSRPGSTGASVGASTGGSGTTGASMTNCVEVYCAAFYQCDPVDGSCKCGGEPCGSENCDAASGTCLAGCSSGSFGALTIVSSPAIPSGAGILPSAVVGTPYAVQLVSDCGTPPYNSWTNVTTLPSGLTLLRTGWLRGVPTSISNGGPFEFQVEVRDLDGGTAFQNYVLMVTTGGGS